MSNTQAPQGHLTVAVINKETGDVIEHQGTAMIGIVYAHSDGEGLPASTMIIGKTKAPDIVSALGGLTTQVVAELIRDHKMSIPKVAMFLQDAVHKGVKKGAQDLGIPAEVLGALENIAEHLSKDIAENLFGKMAKGDADNEK